MEGIELLQEFGQICLDQLKNVYFVSGQFAAFYSVSEPYVKRGYPYIVMHENNSNEDMQTTTNPLIEGFYLLEVVDKYQGTSQNEEVAKLAHQRCMQAADSIKEVLRNDSTVRGLCLDFRATVTRPQIMQHQDFAEIRQPLEIRATFNTNAGVYGYSLYGYAVYG